MHRNKALLFLRATITEWWSSHIIISYDYHSLIIIITVIIISDKNVSCSKEVLICRKSKIAAAESTSKQQPTLKLRLEPDIKSRKGISSGIQGQTGRDLERAAGMVKDVLCWETPGESYVEARRLSSIVDC